MTARFPKLATVFACLLLALAGCGNRDIESGTYRATLKLPGGELPFGLEITRQGDGAVAFLVNGPERVRVSDVRIRGRRIDMSMPALGNRLSAKRSGDALEGKVGMVGPGGSEEEIPFRAEPGS